MRTYSSAPGHFFVTLVDVLIELKGETPSLVWLVLSARACTSTLLYPDFLTGVGTPNFPKVMLRLMARLKWYDYLDNERELTMTVLLFSVENQSSGDAVQSGMDRDSEKRND